MDRIKEVTQKIASLDEAIMKKAQSRLDSLTKPQGSLGRLEELAKQICGITGKISPAMAKKIIFTLAADHGVADEGVSAYPKEVTAQMVYNFLSQGAGINVLAKHVGARVVVADLGVAEKIKIEKLKVKNFLDKKVGFGTKNMAKGPAMSPEEAIRSIEAGMEIFESQLQDGIDIAGTGEMGIGNTTSASAITSVFTNTTVEEVSGRGTGLDDLGLKHKINIIKKALEVNKPSPKDPLDVLAKVGGFEIGGLAGIILNACANKIPVVIDGFISSAAALVAFQIEPKVKDYLIASHNSQEKGHKAILKHIGLSPLFDLNLRLGEGTAAALGIGIAEASIKILTQMATFEGAKVSERL